MPDLDINAASAEIGASLSATFGSSDSEPSSSPEPSTVERESTPTEPSAPQTPGDAPAEGKGEEETGGSVPSATPSHSFPSSWNKSLEAEWSTLTPTVQAEITRRESDILKGIEQYKSEAAYAKSVKSVFEPYSQVIAQHNIDPLEMTSRLINAHYQLTYAPAEQKQELFRRLAQSYGIDLSGNDESPYIDPVTAQLQSDVQALKSQRQQEQQQYQRQQQVSIQQQIADFRADPAHTHFERLEPAMAKLITAGLADNLKDAYNQALYLDPELRSQELARQQTEAAEKARVEQQKKVEEARKAMSVNANSGSVNSRAASPSSDNLEDTLNDTLRTIRARG